MLLINFVLVVSLVTSTVYGASHLHPVSDGEESQSSFKARRGGSVGLIPFPRVGRAGPSWQLSPLDFHELRPEESKRQGLIPFPRVGRSNNMFPFPRTGRSGTEKSNDRGYMFPVLRTGRSDHLFAPPRTGRLDHLDSDANGMWFGPRLGRVSKRDQYSDESAWAMYALRDFPEHDYSSHIAKQSDEIPDDDLSDQTDIEAEVNRTA